MKQERELLLQLVFNVHSVCTGRNSLLHAMLSNIRAYYSFIKSHTVVSSRQLSSVIRLRNSLLLSLLLVAKVRMWVIPICWAAAMQATKCKVHLSILQLTTITHWNKPGALKEQEPGARSAGLLPVCHPVLGLSLASTLPGAVMNDPGCPSASASILCLHRQRTVPASGLGKLMSPCSFS